MTPERERLRATIRTLLAKISVANAEVDVLLELDLKMAREEGDADPLPQVFVGGAPVPLQPGDAMRLAAEAFLVEQMNYPEHHRGCRIMVVKPCADCGGTHHREVDVAFVGRAADGAPIFWDQPGENPAAH